MERPAHSPSLRTRRSGGSIRCGSMLSCRSEPAYCGQRDKGAFCTSRAESAALVQQRAEYTIAESVNTVRARRCRCVCATTCGTRRNDELNHSLDVARRTRALSLALFGSGFATLGIVRAA